MDPTEAIQDSVVENEIENPFLASSTENYEPENTMENAITQDVSTADASQNVSESLENNENVTAENGSSAVEAVDSSAILESIKGETFFIPDGMFDNESEDDDFLSYIKVAEDKSSDYFIDATESESTDEFSAISSTTESITDSIPGNPVDDEELQIQTVTTDLGTGMVDGGAVIFTDNSEVNSKEIINDDATVDHTDDERVEEIAFIEDEQAVDSEIESEPVVSQPEIVDNAGDVAAMLNSSASGNSYITNIESTEPEENSNSFSSLFSSELNNSFDNDESLFGSGSGIPSSTSVENTFGEEGYSDISTEEITEPEIKNDAKFLSHDFGSMNQPKEEKNGEFLSYNQSEDKFAPTEPEKAPANEYQNTLGDLIENFTTVNQNQVQETIAIKSDEIDNKIQIRPFGSTIIESARELGEDVKVRTHDSNTQEMYAARFYYRDNFLRMFINAILFIVILAESFIFYTIAKNAIGSTGKFDVVVYIAAIVIAFILPIYAAIQYWLNPNSKKRLDSGDVSNLKFRIVVMVLLCLLIFLLHLYLGMPLSGNISEYVVSLFLPMILTTNLPLSSGIFLLMYKSPYFVIKDR